VAKVLCGKYLGLPVSIEKEGVTRVFEGDQT